LEEEDEFHIYSSNENALLGSGIWLLGIAASPQATQSS
jgi:hypothetical protein